MIIPDVNLLLYAEVDATPHHGAARAWWEATLSSDRRVGLAAPVLFGFVRLATHPRVFSLPMTVSEAASRVEAWLARDNVVALIPGQEYYSIAMRLLRAIGTGGNMTTDVQIASHAFEMNGEVCSNDGDFSRFDGLRWSNPLKR